MSTEEKKKISRRDFIQITTLAAGAALLAACKADEEQMLEATQSQKESPVEADVETMTAGRPLPDDAAPYDQQILRIPAADGRYVLPAVGGYTCIFEVAGLMHEKLVKYGNDWELENQLAESWEVSDDGIVYTYHLRSDIVWDDGTPITADDFVNHFKTQMDPANASPVAWFWYPLKNAEEIHKQEKSADELGIRAIDSKTVEMTLKEPTPYWNYLMAYINAAPPSKEMWDEFGDAMYSSVESSNFSGPWKMVEWSKDRRLVMEARDNYHGVFPGYLKRIEYVLGEASTYWAAYQNNEIDVILNISSPGDVEAILKDPQLSKEHYTWPEWRSWYILFHSQDGPFADLNARKAVAHAIDRDALCNGPLKNLAVPGYTVVPPGFPGSQADDEEVHQIQRYDPDLAKDYLEKAGYPNGDGFPELEMWLRGATEGSSYTASAEFIQAALQDVLGISIKVRPEERQIYVDAMGNYEIPITLINWGFDFPDPYDMIGVPFRSKYPNLGGRTDWVNEEYDRMIDEAQPTLDMEARYEKFKEAERLLLEDVGCVMLWYPTLHQLWKPWVKGIKETKNGMSQFFFKKPMMHDFYIAEH